MAAERTQSVKSSLALLLQVLLRCGQCSPVKRFVARFPQKRCTYDPIRRRVQAVPETNLVQPQFSYVGAKSFLDTCRRSVLVMRTEC